MGVGPLGVSGHYVLSHVIKAIKPELEHAPTHLRYMVELSVGALQRHLNPVTSDHVQCGRLGVPGPVVLRPAVLMGRKELKQKLEIVITLSKVWTDSAVRVRVLQ